MLFNYWLFEYLRVLIRRGDNSRKNTVVCLQIVLPYTHTLLFPLWTHLSYRDGSIYFSDHSQGGVLGQDPGSPGSDDKDDLSDDGLPIQTKIEPLDVNSSQAQSVYTDLQKAMPSGGTHPLSMPSPYPNSIGPPVSAHSHAHAHGIPQTNGPSSADVASMLQEYQSL